MSNRPIRRKSFTFYRLPAVDVAHNKGVPSCLKIWIKGVLHLTSKSRSKICAFLPPDLDHRFALHFWIVDHSRNNQVGNQKSYPPRLLETQSYLLMSNEQ